MHSAIFVATVVSQHQIAWQEFLTFANQKVKVSQYVSRLAEDVWLVNVTGQPAALGHLIALADSKGVAYGILPFAEAPQWLPVSYDPNTN